MPSNAKPSVTREFRARVAPDLEAMGFRSDGSKRFRRVVEGVLQAVLVHVETRSRRTFLIEYCAMLLCVPQEHYVLTLGGRFPVGSMNGNSYYAETPERLDRSIGYVREKLPQLLGWFRTLETLEGFLAAMAALERSLPPALARTGHIAFAQACGHGQAGRIADARHFAERALTDYEAVLAAFRAQYPGADHWAPRAIANTRALLAALESSNAERLLGEWRAFTVRALKLDGLIAV
jgi:hypothetical protein